MYRKIFFIVLIIVLSLQLVSAEAAAEKTLWTFNDESVDSWLKGGSNGKFYVEDGGLTCQVEMHGC